MKIYILLNILLVFTLSLVGCAPKPGEKLKVQKAAKANDKPAPTGNGAESQILLTIAGQDLIEPSNEKDCPIKKARYISIPGEKKNSSCAERRYRILDKIPAETIEAIHPNTNVISASFGCSMEELNMLEKNQVITGADQIHPMRAKEVEQMESRFFNVLVLCQQPIQFEKDIKLQAHTIILQNAHVTAGGNLTLNAVNMHINRNTRLIAPQVHLSVVQFVYGTGELIIGADTSKFSPDLKSTQP